MRIVITGATGNVGTALVQRLSADPVVTHIIGVARRAPQAGLPDVSPKVEYRTADVSCSDLLPLFEGADAVVHLAWLIQPARNTRKLEAVNVRGTRRVVEAAQEARVPHLLVASSVGAYSPGPKTDAVSEDWPTKGVATSLYARQKAAVERILDEVCARGARVARLRPGLIFQKQAGSEIKRLFVGRLFPRRFLAHGWIRFVPRIANLRFQAVHAQDVAEAFCLAITKQAEGAFNIAADPVLDSNTLAEALGARPIPITAGILRALMAGSYRLHLQPTPPGWLDMGLAVPIMSTRKAQAELGWRPRWSATDALKEVLEGMREGASAPTAPLASRA